MPEHDCTEAAQKKQIHDAAGFSGATPRPLATLVAMADTWVYLTDETSGYSYLQ